jgi:hypothetical protein
MELAPHDPEIAGVMQKFLLRMSKAFSIGLENARNNGEVTVELDLRDAGDFLTGAFFGLIVLARAGFPEKTLEAFVATTMSALST